MNNPYQAPSSDIRLPLSGEIDTTSPFSRAGRFTRLSYVAWIMITGMTIGLIAQAILVGVTISGGEDSMASKIGFGVFVILQIAAFVCQVLFSIRRTHDVSKGGWWVVLFMLPLINFYLWFKRGDEGINAFGPPRPTPGWEKIVAYITISLVVLALIGGIIAAIMLPALQSA